MDNEVYGAGNSYDYGLRIYDPRIGRFLSVDPLDKHFPFWSPYHFAGNMPIRYIDLDGGELMDPMSTAMAKWFFIDAAITVTTEPTSAKAKVYATLLGVANAAGGVIAGPINLVANPIETGKAILTTVTNTPAENALAYGMNMAQTYAGLPEPLVNYAVAGHVTTDIAIAVAPVAKSVHKATSTGSKVIAKAAFVEETGNAAKPPTSAQVNPRHILNPTNIAKGKTYPSTVAPAEILSQDIAAYNAGKYTKTTGGNVVINNRTYGLKNEGKTIYPVSGGAPEFIDLTQGQIKAIQLIVNTPAAKLTDAVKGAGISTADLNYAQEFIKNH